MNSSWNKQILILSIVAALMAVVGIISTEKPIFGSLFMPVIFILFLSYVEKDIVIDLKYNYPSHLKVNDKVTVGITIKVKKGFGLLNFQLPVYREMEIVTGTNVHILFKGFREREQTFTFEIMALRRGVFQWQDILVEYVPIIGIRKKKQLVFPIKYTLEVEPNIKVLKKSQFQIKNNKSKPRNSVTRIGPPTHEFESIREYSAGDPFKSINWKSSAKTSYKGNLMVNVYEREGLKNFIFYIDTSPFMSKGSSIENPLEYSILLVLSGSKYLISKNNNVGLWPIKPGNLKSREFVIPSSGMDTFNRIKQSLLNMETRPINSSAFGFQNSFKRILIETRPKVMIFSNMERGNISRIYNIAKDLSKFNILPLIVDIRAESITAKNLDPRLGAVFSSKNYNFKNANKTKVKFPVLRWDPVNEPIGKAAYKLAMEAGW
jgi:uncharacterized protein (DUF58 family)